MELPQYVERQPNKMQAPFYLPDAEVPSTLHTNEFTLRMLRATDVDLDYAAVMANKDILQHLTHGSWPREDFTIEENLADLEEHEADFLARRGFTYTVMNPGETECLGCVYLYPLDFEGTIDGIQKGEGGVWFWVRPRCVNDNLDRRLLTALLAWFPAFASDRIVLHAYAHEAHQLEIFQDAGLHEIASYPTKRGTLQIYR